MKKNLENQMLLELIFEPKPVAAPTVYDYFKGFADLDYTKQENRQKLLDLFVRKVIAYDDKEPTIYYNISGDNTDYPIKENESELRGFGFKNLGGEGGI